MKNNPSVGFSLTKINTEQFALFEDNYKVDADIKVETNLSFGIDIVEKRVMVTTKFTFEIRKKPIISIQTSCYFNIEENSWDSFISDNTIALPKGFASHMSVLTVGASRGILHSETKNTIFNKYILPPIDITKLVSEDVVFKL